MTEPSGAAVQQSAPEPEVANGGEPQELRAYPGDARHEEIAVRAYYYWMDRGSVDGSPELDWERAAQELRAANGDKGRQRLTVE